MNDDDLIAELQQGGMAPEQESEAQAFRRDETGLALRAPVRRVAPQQRQPTVVVRRAAQPPQVRRVAPQPRYAEPVYEEEQPEPMYEEESPSDVPLNEPRTEAEARLHRARYFEILLANPIFPRTNSQGEWVENALRDWAENELAILLGMQPTKDLAPFTKPQIVALRSLANKLLGNVANATEKSEPEKRAAPPPAVKPVAKQPIPRRPLMKRPTPQPEPEPVVDDPPPPARKPAQRRPVGNALIPPRKPAAKLRRPTGAAESQSQAPRRESVQPPPANGSPVPEIDESTLVDGEIIERGGKRYKVTFANIEGITKPVFQDVTPAATVEGVPPIPMPEGLALETTTMTQASAQVERAIRGSRVLQRATNAALQS